MSEWARWYPTPAAALLTLAITAAPTRAQYPGPPLAWHTIAVRGEYVFGSDSVARIGSHGRVSATIRSAADFPLHPGLLQQSIRADHYRGHRLRLSGYLRTTAAEEARLWMRVDDDSGVSVSDFMEQRPVRGDTDWRLYAIVLDVPRNARGITFGIYLNGRGEVFADDVDLEVVGADCATTGHRGGLADHARAPAAIHVDGASSYSYSDQRSLLIRAYADATLEPENLDFEEKLGPPAPLIVVGARR